MQSAPIHAGVQDPGAPRGIAETQPRLGGLDGPPQGVSRAAPPSHRPALAQRRAIAARRLLANCHFCAHHCGVDRLAGERGRCHAGAAAKCFLAQTEVNDEPALAPCFAIALSGCDLRCDFCISGAESWNPGAGADLDAEAMAHQAVLAVASGARSIMILGGEPTVHLHAALDLAARMPGTTPLVWKTNAHGTAQARRLLDGVFDVWVADYKFGNDVCASRLAHVPDYTRVVRENLVWAAAHTQLIVRHLLMPGHVECCWKPIASWLSNALPDVTVSLRNGFWPAWHSRRHPELHQTATSAEWVQANAIASQCGLSNSQ